MSSSRVAREVRDAFVGRHDAPTIAELATATGRSESAVRRAVESLIEIGHVEEAGWAWRARTYRLRRFDRLEGSNAAEAFARKMSGELAPRTVCEARHYRPVDPPLPFTLRTQGAATKMSWHVVGIEISGRRTRQHGSEGQIGDGDEYVETVRLWLAGFLDDPRLVSRTFEDLDPASEFVPELVSEISAGTDHVRESIERELYR